MTDTQRSALKEICDALIDCVRATGSLGKPAGELYAVLMTYGCTLEQFEKVMSILVSVGKLRKQGNLYFAAVSRG